MRFDDIGRLATYRLGEEQDQPLEFGLQLRAVEVLRHLVLPVSLISVTALSSTSEKSPSKARSGELFANWFITRSFSVYAHTSVTVHLHSRAENRIR